MNSKHGKTGNKQKTAPKPTHPAIVSEAHCQEHPSSGEGGTVKDSGREPSSFPPKWRLDMIAVIVSVVALFAYFVQAYYMRKAMTVDQRAWVSVPFPAGFPLNGNMVSIATQIKNSGKTPARNVQADWIATVLKKGEQPTIGDFSVGHPHEHLYAGAIFPEAPYPVTPIVKRYGEHAADVIIVDDSLRNDIANGERFIIFYDRITYTDAFGVSHWTQFCTGTGSAISDNLKKCVTSNDFDPNED